MARKIETRYVLRGEDKTKGALKSVRGNMRKTEKAANGITSSLKNMMGPLIAIVGVGAIFRMGKGALDAADHIAKMSVALNISTEALSQYHHVAGLAGVETAKFENALQKMNKNVSDAADGFGLAKQHLEKLRLDVQKLHRMKADEKFETIADAIMGMANASTRAAAAGALFGERVGAQLLPMMIDGAAGIKKYREEADAFGATLSALDAKSAEDAVDALQRLQTKWDAFKKSLIFSDEVRNTLNWIANAFKDMGDYLKQRKMDKEIEKIELALRKSGEAAEKFKIKGFMRHAAIDGEALRKYATEQYHIAEALKESAAEAQAFGEAIVKANKGFIDFSDTSKFYQFGSGKGGTGTGPVADMLLTPEQIQSWYSNLKKKLDMGMISLGQVKLEMPEDLFKDFDKWINKLNLEDKLAAQYKALVLVAKKYGVELNKSIFDPGTDQVSIVKKSLEEIRKEITAQFHLLEEQNKLKEETMMGPASAGAGMAFVGAAAEMAGLLPVLDAYNDKLQEVQINIGTIESMNWALGESFANGIGGAIDVVSDAFGMFIENMISSEKRFIMMGRAFKRLIGGMIADLVSLILKAVIANALLSALGLTGAGLTGIAKIFQSSIAAMGQIDLEKRAYGGPVRAGQSYIVGEKGPERLTMGSDGYITPNNRLGQGSITNNIVIHSEGDMFNDPLALRRVAEKLNDELEKVQGTYFEPSTT